MTKNRSSLRAIALSMFVLASCGQEGDETTNDEQSRDEALVGGGDGIGAIPGIGILMSPTGGRCTATLINSRVILTAAHCNDYNRNNSQIGGSRPGFVQVHSGYWFTPSAKGAKAVEVGRQYLTGYNTNAADVAVYELLSDIPSSVATPLQIANNYPKDGDAVTDYGAGAVAGKWVCSGTPNTCSWVGLKEAAKIQVQMAANKWKGRTTTSGHSCPGDSGGPTLNSAGEIVAVQSTADCEGPGLDGKGDVIGRKRDVDNAMAMYGRQALCTACIREAFRTDGGWYLHAEDGGGGDFDATGTEINSTTTFRMVGLGNGYFALQTESGHFVSAAKGGGGGMSADKDVVGPNEVFFSNNSYTFLRTMLTKHWVSAEGGGGGDVNANRSALGVWETFAAEYP